MLNRSIAWFIDNPVATNLTMCLMIVTGLLTLSTMKREEFPEMQVDAVQVSVTYPQASAEETDGAICVKLNEQITGTEGVKKLKSSAREGNCSVTIELNESADKTKALADIKNIVDKIDSFPDDSEQPIVTDVRTSNALLQVVLSSTASDELALKRLGQKIRRDLLGLPGVSQVALAYTRPEEISVNVSEFQLRQHELSISDVANAIRRNSFNLPAGIINSQDGEILVRTAEQRDSEEAFKSIVVSAKADGTLLRLSDIATIHDEFKDTGVRASIDEKPSIIIDVRRIGEEDVIDVAEKVHHYFEESERWLPEGVDYLIWQDESNDLRDRMDQMADSGISGLILVIITLSLFMQPKLAFWVTAGIPISILGATMFFPSLDVTISTFSIVALMLVLGIVVDDAVVVGERVFSLHSAGYSPSEAAKLGTQEVSTAVVFGVLTTIATFSPLVFVTGAVGFLAKPIGIVTITILIFSLIESQLLLPSHLAHSLDSQKKEKKDSRWNRFLTRINQVLDNFVQQRYAPFLQSALKNKFTTLSASFGILIIAVALSASGRVPVQFFPPVPGERMYASLTLPEGTPIEETEAALKKITQAAYQLREEIRALNPQENAAVMDHIIVSLGKKLIRSTTSGNATVGRHFAEVGINLNLPEDYRGPGADELASRWREYTGPIPNAVKQTFDAKSVSIGNAIEIELRGDNLEQLDTVSSQIKAGLYTVPGVFDIYDTFQYGKQELQLSMLPEGYNLGFNTIDLTQQVAKAFQGEEVQRIQRGEEEVKVIVRYPDDERESIGNLESMRIRSPAGIEVPFSAIADMTYTRSMSSIDRIDGEKVVKIIADVDQNRITTDEVLQELSRHYIPEIKAQNPQVEVLLAGEAEESLESINRLLQLSLVAMFAVYALLAIPLKSYLQPLVVMSAIPFGLVGAIAAHFVVGQPFLFFSILGIVALSGVVVNAALVLVDRANTLHRQGLDHQTAIYNAAIERFRPVFLTSTTTFIGLVPLIATQDISTRLLFVPIALSLSGGVLFSTLITLILVPALYMILEGVIAKKSQKSLETQLT
ncbi:efflux RND transporter permease subunit [Spongiibacter sp. KMU-158]|uniref:Efflux RND transporter permease subunit n=1 Tax=Spongiibacter pelagi TaxID=2760804 RepID=A0A927GVJ4_9GAMM|nr:efflux RND transporter permease subunit [Spongiibacter pelagi]MBD2857942.1 efflux RND transporter permease subunit [Spongiibacter pelagi]